MKSLRKNLTVFIVLTGLLSLNEGCCVNTKQTLDYLEYSDYVTLVVTVPETHADLVRKAMGDAGAGKIGDYSHCSFSIKGIGRGKFNLVEGPIEEEIEERIETICSLDLLERVLEEIRKAHPHEETIIDIFPVYAQGKKKAK